MSLCVCVSIFPESYIVSSRYEPLMSSLCRLSPGSCPSPVQLLSQSVYVSLSLMEFSPQLLHSMTVFGVLKGRNKQLCSHSGEKQNGHLQVFTSLQVCVPAHCH